MTKEIHMKTSFVSNILDMVMILIFPFLGLKEIGENNQAVTV